MKGVEYTSSRQGIVAEAHLHTPEGKELKWFLRKDGRKYRWYGIDAAITTGQLVILGQDSPIVKIIKRRAMAVESLKDFA